MKEGLPKVIVIPALTLFALLWFGVAQRIVAQGGNGIIEPTDGDNVSGIVVVRGTAVHPQFLRYELAFLQSTGPGSDWIVFAQGDQPVRDGTLAVWDTTVGQPASPIFPDGQYQLRLRVVRQDYNYDEFFVRNLSITNLSVTPTVTTTLTATLPIPATLPSATELEATRLARSGTLPTLTPFPTPSPLPTVANGTANATQDSEGDIEPQGGLLNRILEIDTSRFGQAFWFGVGLVAVMFACFAAYVLLRAVWRRIRRLSR